MKEVVILIALNVIGFLSGWFFVPKIVEWVNRSRYSGVIKTALHSLLWSLIIVGGILNHIPAWITFLAIIAYLSSIFAVFND